MNVSLKDVSVDDIKKQLQLLGHDIPDELVETYLREVHENVTPEAILPKTSSGVLNNGANSSERAFAPRLAANQPTLKDGPSERTTNCVSYIQNTEGLVRRKNFP